MSRTWEEFDELLIVAIDGQDIDALIQLSHELTETFDTKAAHAASKFCYGNAMFLKGNYRESLEHSIAAFEQFESLVHAGQSSHNGYLHMSSQSIGHAYMQLGNFTEALEYFIRALETPLEDPPAGFPSGIYNSIAVLYLKTGFFVKAIEYFERSRVLVLEAGNQMKAAFLSANICSVQMEVEQFEEAWLSNKKAEEYYLNIEDIIKLAHVNMRFADICLKTNNYSEALSYYTKAKHVLTKLEKSANALFTDLGIVESLLGLRQVEDAYTSFLQIEIGSAESVDASIAFLRTKAHIEMHTSRLDDAANTLNELLSIAHSYNLPARIMETHQDYRHLAAVRKDLDAYIHHNDAAVKIKNEILGSEVQIKMALISKEHEIELERQQREIERERRIQAEKELALKTAHLGTQIELVAAFKKQLQTVLVESSGAETAIKRVREKLDELQDEQIDWVHFEREFVDLHPEFVSAIRSQYPALTKQEIKMCQLIRIGLKSHEIANILSLSERSVENHRFNLRKKLGLNSSDKLHDIVGRIS